MNIEFFKNKKVLLILAPIGIILLLIIFSNKSSYKDSKNIVGNSTQLFAEYSDGKFVYFVEYPGWWIREEFNGKTIIRNEASNVIILIKTEKFSGSSEDIFIESGAASEELKNNPNYLLKTFERVIYKGMPGYFAEGVYNDGATLWNYKEYEIYSVAKKVKYIIRIQTEHTLASYYNDIVNDILVSITLHKN